MIKTYIISDLHFAHDNILNFEGKVFKTVQERTDLIVERWNKTVHSHDIVYILGDLFINKISDSEMKSLIDKLNGYKILIQGNHDHFTNAKYKKLGIDEIIKGPFYMKGGQIILSHEPVLEAFNNPYVINLYGHTHLRSLTLSNYFNVCACNIDYTPINIDNFRKYQFGLKNRHEKFGTEWYFNFLDNKD